MPSAMVAERYCLLPRPVSPPPTQEPLTHAERAVLSYLCAGYSNKEIARFLGKAEPTVKHQVSACLRKFGLSSRMRLMAALR
jgi:DNA-binding NarL/FixJ family response regulator